jgi:hypothetical protein
VRDWNHYKKAYSGEWDAGNRRERLVADTLERLGLEPQLEGLGAGSSEFIPGRAQAHGKEIAAPDIYLPETEVYVEVTGTNVGWVRPDEDIRVRPDKFEAGLATTDADHWVVHVLDGPALVRCIELTRDTCEKFVGEGTSIDTRHDTDETYVEIDPDHDCVEPVTTLLEHVAPDRSDAYDDALHRAFATWTSVDDITEGVRHSMGLKLSSESVWNGHDSIASKLDLVDHVGDAVELTIFENNDDAFTDREWDEGEWYFFTDLNGGSFGGEPELTLSSDASVRRLAPEHRPEGLE